mgnify:FL=1
MQRRQNADLFAPFVFIEHFRKILARTRLRVFRGDAYGSERYDLDILWYAEELFYGSLFKKAYPACAEPERRSRKGHVVERDAAVRHVVLLARDLRRRR